jgi:hypothetical protein
VKFYRLSLRAWVELDGGQFGGFHHVDGWVPQRLGSGDQAEPSAALSDATPSVAGWMSAG